MKNIVKALMIIQCLFFLASCNDLNNDVIDVTNVTLDQTETTISVGNTVQLTATIAPENATNKTVTWTSNNTEIATVSDTGLVTAVAVGTAVITVTTDDGNKEVSCSITISKADGDDSELEQNTDDYDFIYEVINNTTGKLTVSNYIRDTEVEEFSEGILAKTEDVVIAIGETYQFKYKLSELIEKYSDENISLGGYFFPEGKWRCGGWENNLDQSNKKHTVTVTDSETSCMNGENSWSDLADDDSETTDDIVVPDEILLSAGTYNNEEIKSFYIGKYELTQKEYVSLIDNNPSGFNSNLQMPVNGCTPLQAMEYCNALSKYKGYDVVYTIAGTSVTADFSKDGYRLPTLQEWLYAANSGIKANEGTYSGSSDVDSVAWYSGNANGTPHCVGLKTSNGFGLYDTSGNVMEYCWDGTSSIFDECGGSWQYDETKCLSIRTDGGPIGANNRNFGFRVVRNAN